MTEALPIEAVVPDVLAALRKEGVCVLVAPTGAGKTTRLPPAIVRAGLGPVWVLEPRRLAARAAARRVAHERKVRLGEEVGYHVRFDRRISRRTEIAYVTEGLFLRRLQDDPFLQGISCVVFDEFHERSLELDLALALVQRVRTEVRPELSIVVTSATLDAEALSEYFAGAPIVRSEGRLFPVDIQHVPPHSNESLVEVVERGVRNALDGTPGDVLTFLPGVGEIRAADRALRGIAQRSGLELHQLYGDLPAREQDAVLEPSANRKVVLATNVAESSVTVPGVTAVVDTGYARQMRHDPRLGLDRLVRVRISRAAADQRAGRAGREAPGLCLRLWSLPEQRTLAAFDEPEVRRADLTAAVLQLVAWGERELATFPWFEPPSKEALERALARAEELEALDEDQRLTDVGRALVRIPAQPRLGRLLLAGQELGVGSRAAAAAAILGERDPWRRTKPGTTSQVARPSESDVLDRVRALEAFDRAGPHAAPQLEPGAARACLAVQRQLERLLGPESRQQAAESSEADDALLRSLVAAFPDRLTRRRPDDERRGVLVGGRGVRLAPQCAQTPGPLFLAIELDAGDGEAWVRQASHVERSWVDGGRARTVIDCVFDPKRERVVGRKRELLGPLVLEETSVPIPDLAQAEALLVEAASADLERALDLARPEVAGLLTRLRCLREWCPELDLPDPDSAWLGELLPALAAGARSFADLRKAPLVAHLKARLGREGLAKLDREAPERLRVPSGSALTLKYEVGRPPVLAARIQELFGWRRTPSIARGRVTVLLHLLAPNGRPQQVTSDLESFWSTTYFEVRKELRRRYPKHAWPEDPTAAPPTRGPGRR